MRSLDALDKLRVDASGPDFTFHINGRPVSQVSDSDYTSGQVGFIVETFDESLAHIHYDSLIIREVEAIPPVLTASIPTPTPSPTFTPSPTRTPTPSPTFTPSPTRTRTPTPSLVEEPLCSVVVRGLNLRYGPGTVYAPPITILPNGTRLEPLARSSDARWIQVQVQESGQVGWVAADTVYVSCNLSVVDLPVSKPPPTPVSQRG
jgi:hypothetical protein